jgi:acyl-CoA synthetase (AMP-forming)/AMP-acid ligase II
MASMSPLRFLRQPVDWLRALTRFGADISGGPNFAYELCARRVKPQELAELDLSRWKVAFTGAELVRPETLEAFAARFAPAGFEPTAFYPCYGLAEATLLVSGGTRAQRPRVLSVTRDTLAREGRAVPAQGDEARALVSVGAAGPEHEVAIVDPAQRRERPPSEVGEIWVRGPSVTEGYWRREDDTAEVFAAFTADERGPYLRTGDLGFVCDGELYVTGRIKDVIVVNGRNIYPTDVERACERAVEGLRAGCGAAFGVSSASGEERVAVVYEVRDAEDAGLAATLERLRRAVAMEVSMEPEAVVLVQPRSIPKTSSGKVQRWLVREHFLEERFDVVAAWRASR